MGVGGIAGGRSRKEGESFVVAAAFQVVFELRGHGRWEERRCGGYTLGDSHERL